jgi:ASC-1-like (ASCH) protein
MANYHLVILKKPYLEAILTGRKRIESRFTRTRRAHFARVLRGDKLFLKESSGPVCGMATVASVGDKLFLKESSGPVCGMATVASVKSFENLTPKQMAELKHQYNRDIGGSDEYWQAKAECKFGFLVWLKDVRRISPVRIDKKDWRAWVLLTEKQNFGLLQKRASRGDSL